MTRKPQKKRKMSVTYHRATYNDPDHRTAFADVDDAKGVWHDDTMTDAWAEMHRQVTPAPFQRPKEALKPVIDTHCHELVYAVANLSGQHNLLAQRILGSTSDLTNDDIIVHDALLRWIHDMQNKARELIDNQDESYADPNHWPDPPAGAAELAKRY